jgi:hypothetical protein
MARPTKLNSELVKEITSYIHLGNSPTVSARLVGISPSTYFDWMRKGANQESKFLEFSESIERAKAQAIINRVAEITSAAEAGYWRAAAWLLEKMAPELYGKDNLGVWKTSTPQIQKTNGMSAQKLEASITNIVENRTKKQSNSKVEFVNPTQTKEIRGKQ